MKTFLILSLLLVSTLGGIALAVYLESCDLSQLPLPQFVAQAEADSSLASKPAPQAEPAVRVDPSVRQVSQIALEPAVTQQFDLEKITQSLQRTEAAQQEMAEQQSRSWDVLNKAIDSMRDVATLKVQESRPSEPQLQAPLAAPQPPAVEAPPEPIATPAPPSVKPLIIPDEGDDRFDHCHPGQRDS